MNALELDSDRPSADHAVGVPVTSAVSFDADYWPSADQIQLLRAALLTGEAASAAWDRWQHAVDLKNLDAGSRRLLPLLAHNLRACGVRDSRLEPFEEDRRTVWVVNQLLTARVAPAVRAFHEAGIRTMLLKGAALAQLYYADAGLRPMVDVDVLVPAADASRAFEILRERGWRAWSAESTVIKHAELFVADADHHIDLHWHALWDHSEPDADDELWARAEPAMFGDAPTSAPDPADLFLVVVVHGLRSNAVPPVRWVADAMTILAAARGRFDWTRLADHARKRACVLPVRRALEFLDRTFGAPIPSEAHAALGVHRASLVERVEQRMRDVPSPFLGSLPKVVCRHARQAGASGPMAVVLRLPAYLQRAYGLPTVRALPWSLCVRFARHLRLAVGGRQRFDQRHDG